MRFDKHLSGGNSTRFGLFSLLYGLHGAYWFPVFNEQRSPVLVDTLLRLDYDVQVFSSASQYYPELRSTAWSAIPDNVHDDFPGKESWEARTCRRRRPSARGSSGATARGTSGRSSASSCSTRPTRPTRRPPGTGRSSRRRRRSTTSSSRRARGPDPTILGQVFNRYRNAVHFADGVAGGIVDALRASGAYDDTVLIVTGDHGEEFRETGFFGHTSNFTDKQLAVPFLIRVPGEEPRVVEHRSTHLDVAPTILELLGADPSQRDQWTNGENLFEEIEGRRHVASGWKELGVWIDEGILRIPLHDRWSFDVELYDYGWRHVPGDGDVLDRELDTLAELAEDCRRFLR